MAPKDLMLALVVIVVWGMNFVVIKVGLDDIPPMLLGSLRFLLAAFPAVLFIKRPQMPLRWLLAYGGTISLGQFAFLFSAMKVGMPAGLASLVLQSQALAEAHVSTIGTELRRCRIAANQGGEFVSPARSTGVPSALSSLMNSASSRDWACCSRPEWHPR